MEVEELIEGLTTSTNITLEDDDVSLIHPRYDQYKQRKSKLNQEDKRKRFLEDQKRKRLEVFERNRNVDEQEDFCKGEQQRFGQWLMLSVWLVDVPSNFNEDWLFCMCPQGKRTIVIAESGITKAFSRRSELLVKFPSHLPGGRKTNNGYTVVDCIWDMSLKTFFIIDVLVWTVPFTNCEAELRYFWLQNKISETPELGVHSKSNRYKFQLLERAPVTNLSKNMMIHPVFENNLPKIDGLLFFHKDSLYTEGKSPLVTWLKPFMVEDMLGITVSDEYKKEIPSKYKKKIVKMDVDKDTTQELSSKQD